MPTLEKIQNAVELQLSRRNKLLRKGHGKH